MSKENRILRDEVKSFIEMSGYSQNKISKEADVQQATLSRFLTSDTIPNISSEFYFKLLRFINNKTSNASEVDTTPIDVFAYAGAGDSWDFETIKTDEKIFVPLAYKKQDLKAIRIKGDSMFPTMNDGAYVGVIPFDGTLLEGRIYAINREPHGLMVKRIFLNADGLIILRSDNPNHDDLIIPYDGYENIILGRIVWVMQEL